MERRRRVSTIYRKRDFRNTRHPPRRRRRRRLPQISYRNSFFTNTRWLVIYAHTNKHVRCVHGAFIRVQQQQQHAARRGSYKYFDTCACVKEGKRNRRGIFHERIINLIYVTHAAATAINPGRSRSTPATVSCPYVYTPYARVE